MMRRGPDAAGSTGCGADAGSTGAGVLLAVCAGLVRVVVRGVRERLVLGVLDLGVGFLAVAVAGGVSTGVGVSDEGVTVEG